MTIGDYEFIVRLTLGMTLMWAGSRKLPALNGFAAGILAYQLIPVRLAYPAAVVVTALELVIGTTLAAGVQRPMSSISAAILVATFAVAIVASLVRRLKIDCHCYGSDDDPIGAGTALRSVVLLAMSVGLVLVNMSTSVAIASQHIPPAITIATGFAVLLYCAPLVGTAWQGLRLRIDSFGRPTHRLTYGDLPLTATLRESQAALPRAGQMDSGLDPTREGTGAA